MGDSGFAPRACHAHSQVARRAPSYMRRASSQSWAWVSCESPCGVGPQSSSWAVGGDCLARAPAPASMRTPDGRKQESGARVAVHRAPLGTTSLTELRLITIRLCFHVSRLEAHLGRSHGFRYRSWSGFAGRYRPMGPLWHLELLALRWVSALYATSCFTTVCGILLPAMVAWPP